MSVCLCHGILFYFCVLLFFIYFFWFLLFATYHKIKKQNKKKTGVPVRFEEEQQGPYEIMVDRESGDDSGDDQIQPEFEDPNRKEREQLREAQTNQLLASNMQIDDDENAPIPPGIDIEDYNEELKAKQRQVYQSNHTPNTKEKKSIKRANAAQNPAEMNLAGFEKKNKIIILSVCLCICMCACMKQKTKTRINQNYLTKKKIKLKKMCAVNDKVIVEKSTQKTWMHIGYKES